MITPPVISITPCFTKKCKVPPPSRLNASELMELYTASRLINPKNRTVIQIARSPFSLWRRVVKVRSLSGYVEITGHAQRV